MATINESILNAALKDGLIHANLTETQQIYLQDYVLTANKILKLINSYKELTVEDLIGLTGLHDNTLKIYLRWMEKNYLIRVDRHEIESKDKRRICSLYKAI